MGAERADPGPVLALDTSGPACSVALLAGGALTDISGTFGPTGHSQELTDMAARLLDAAGIGFGDLGRIAVTVGPGSFTGVRIGLAAARGFALATGRPALGFTTLEVTAAAAARDAALPPGTRLRVISDARRGEVYWQDFEVGGDWTRSTPLSPPAVAAPSSLPPLPEGAARTGSGLALLERLAGIADIEGQDAPCPKALAALGAAAAIPEPYLPPRPLYLRAPDAKLPGGRTLPAGPS